MSKICVSLQTKFYKIILCYSRDLKTGPGIKQTYVLTLPQLLVGYVNLGKL